jgi:hypothetical protein
VWVHLIADHNTTVSYGAIRAQVTKPKTERAGRPNATGQQRISDW